MTGSARVVDELAATLAAAGVRRMFGVPGGGGGLDLIAAAAEWDINFVLARGETAAALMAAVTGELSGAPGVVLTTLGPGLASAVNGVAYAALDRAPLVVVSDCLDAAQRAWVSHQALDHEALLRPLCKARRRPGKIEWTAADLLAAAVTHPRGPVHIDLSSEAASGPAGQPRPPATDRPRLAAADAVTRARERLAAARRPVLLVGLEARDRDAASALPIVAEELACPVLPTYKAKGVLPDDHAQVVGLFTGAASEARCVSRADLIVCCGLDPVELIPAPWRYEAPVIELCESPPDRPFVAPDVRLVGALSASMTAIGGVGCRSLWTPDEIADHRDAMRAALMVAEDGDAVRPADLVAAVRAAAPEDCRITVDAGAHMIPVMAFWRAHEPNGVLISNGLSTMGFALPAAIASALHEPGRPVVAFTGDGGLKMCLGELATAAGQGCRLTVVVLNDAGLSLIELKRLGRGLGGRSMQYDRPDFAAVARGLGCRGFRVDDRGALDSALDAALAHAGPALVDVRVDASGYAAMVKALRG